MKHFGFIILTIMSRCNELIMRRKNTSLGNLCYCPTGDYGLIKRALEQGWGTFLATVDPESCGGPVLTFALRLVGQRFERDFYAHCDERSYLEKLINDGAELLLEDIDSLLRSNALKQK